jgi:insulin receptor
VSVQSSVDDDSSPSSLFHILTQLKPFTQYAFYVKTYTLATEGAGAQSKLQYFRTLPDGKPYKLQ